MDVCFYSQSLRFTMSLNLCVCWYVRCRPLFETLPLPYTCETLSLSVRSTLRHSVRFHTMVRTYTHRSFVSCDPSHFCDDRPVPSQPNTSWKLLPKSVDPTQDLHHSENESSQLTLLLLITFFILISQFPSLAPTNPRRRCDVHQKLLPKQI